MKIRCLAGVLLAALLEAAPVIRDFKPKGAERGKSFKLTLKGSGLTAGAQLKTTLPARISRLSPPANLMRPGSELPFLIELNADAPIGVYPLRLVTADGLSNVVMFSVSHLPEQEESEATEPLNSNGALKKAEKFRIPGVMNGTLGPADVDFYSFTAKAGQRIVFEVEATAAGSAIDPAIELLDATGKVIARNDDAPGAGIDSRLEAAFAADGTYYVRVHDSKYSDQAVNFYRLKAGAYPFAEALFPLGWQSGAPVTVELVGGNLLEPLHVQPDTAARGHYAFLQAPGSHSLPMRFALSDLPHALEPEGVGPHTLPPDTVMNGRIALAKQVDVYRLAVREGEHWMVELKASQLGTSRLDALVTVRDANGKKIATRDDLAGADPIVPFQVPQGVSEVRIAVEDLLGRGGPAYGYQLLARRGPPDFTLSLVTPYVNIPSGGTAEVMVNVQRRGYDGAIKLSIPNLPNGLRQAGGHVAPSAAQQRFDDPNPRFNSVRSTLTITAEEGMPPQTLELSVIGVAETPAGRIERRAQGPGYTVAVRGLRQKTLMAPWLGYELPAAISERLPAKLVVSASHVRMAQGVEYPLQYALERSPGVRLVGQVRQTVATAVGNLRINRGLDRGALNGAFLVNTNFATPTEKFDMLLDATVELEGRQMTITAPIVTFEIVPGYRLELEQTRFRVPAGLAFAIAGKVEREPTFEGGLVKIEAADLPEGADCQALEVPAQHTAFRLTCTTSAALAPGPYEFRITSAAPETGRKAKDTYKIPDLPAILTIEPARVATK